MITTPTNAQLARIRYCQRYGHSWPPLRGLNPGDQHWCDFCGTLRQVGADGAIWYEREWE